MDLFMQAAYEEAKKGREEGGIPIGSVLVLDGKIIGGDTINGYRRAAPFCTLKWRRLKMQAV